jgi:hypothetical protein
VPTLAGVPDGLIDPAREPAARDRSLPPRVRGRIESLAWRGPLCDPHQLGDASGVARNDDLHLDLKERFGFGPSLTKSADKSIMFHTERVRCSRARRLFPERQLLHLEQRLLSPASGASRHRPLPDGTCRPVACPEAAVLEPELHHAAK